jgi:hypothetical protein
MTADELQAIRERADKATPGPWKFNGNEVVAVSSPLVGIAGATSDEDCEFIAAARQDVPTLCNEVYRLTTENTYHSTQLDRAREEIGRLRGALDRIERRAQEADRQFAEREGSPHGFDLSWWRGHADGLSKAAEIARQALAGDSQLTPSPK